MSRGLTDRAPLAELTPLVRRAAGLDPATLVRVRNTASTTTALLRLPFGVLAGRRIHGGAPQPADVVYRCGELLTWLDGHDTAVPATHDADWRGGLPPESGWARIELVPDHVVRGLVRAGALALTEAANREGVPGAQPRAQVTDVLLDSTVLTVTAGQLTAEVNLRLLSALVRMGFLPRDSSVAVDLAGRWLRVAGQYGSVYAERPGSSLGLLR